MSDPSTPESLVEGQLPEGVEKRLDVLAQARDALAGTPEVQSLQAESEAARLASSIAVAAEDAAPLPKRGEAVYDQENL